MNVLKRMVSWVKEEESTVTSEKGLYIMIGVGLVIGVGIVLFEPIKSGFTATMDRFTNATGGSGTQSSFNDEDTVTGGGVDDWN